MIFTQSAGPEWFMEGSTEFEFGSSSMPSLSKIVALPCVPVIPLHMDFDWDTKQALDYWEPFGTCLRWRLSQASHVYSILYI